MLDSSDMSDGTAASRDFGTGLRAALARARERREAESVPLAATEEVVSPELALVAPELRSGTAADDVATASPPPRLRVA